MKLITICKMFLQNTSKTNFWPTGNNIKIIFINENIHILQHQIETQPNVIIESDILNIKKTNPKGPILIYLMDISSKTLSFSWFTKHFDRIVEWFHIHTLTFYRQHFIFCDVMWCTLTAKSAVVCFRGMFWIVALGTGVRSRRMTVMVVMAKWNS